MSVHLARRDPALPLYQIRNPGAAVVEITLVPDQRPIVHPLDVVALGGAVVTGEDHQSLFFQALVAKLGENGSDRIVECADHPCIDAPCFVVMLGEALVVLVSDLHGGVRGVEGEVEKEGSIFVSLDEPNAFIT